MHDDTDGKTDMPYLTRRRFGTLAGAGLTAALAGCSGESGGSSGSNGSSAEQTNTSEQTTTESPSTSGGQTTTESTSTSTSTSTSADTTSTSESTSTSTSSSSSSSSSGSSDPNIESVPETIEVLEHELYDEEYTAGVRGEIENMAGETFNYVEVQAYFYDDEDTRIGDALTNTEDLPPGEVWAFDAVYVGSEDASVIEDYQLEVSDSALE